MSSTISGHSADPGREEDRGDAAVFRGASGTPLRFTKGREPSHVDRPPAGGEAAQLVPDEIYFHAPRHLRNNVALGRVRFAEEQPRKASDYHADEHLR